MRTCAPDMVPPRRPYGNVLGTRLDVATYDDALASVLALVPRSGASLVAAANTHLVAEATANPGYAAVLRTFDVVLPDGMPLVWALRLDGHLMRDRVYGPYFMEHVLKNAPANTTHCFFGGTQECLSKLCSRAREMNPNIRIVDTISPPFGLWSAAIESGLIERINRAGADFVWVALGGVRQETWMALHRERFNRGVFIGVGDAFALIAGACGATHRHGCKAVA